MKIRLSQYDVCHYAGGFAFTKPDRIRGGNYLIQRCPRQHALELRLRRVMRFGVLTL